MRDGGAPALRGGPTLTSGERRSAEPFFFRIIAIDGTRKLHDYALCNSVAPSLSAIAIDFAKVRAGSRLADACISNQRVTGGPLVIERPFSGHPLRGAPVRPTTEHRWPTTAAYPLGRLPQHTAGSNARPRCARHARRGSPDDASPSSPWRLRCLRRASSRSSRGSDRTRSLARLRRCRAWHRGRRRPTSRGWGRLLTQIPYRLFRRDADRWVGCRARAAVRRGMFFLLVTAACTRAAAPSNGSSPPMRRCWWREVPVDPWR
jgi:hypothetical protein